MAAIKRKQPWPLGVNKGPTKLMQTKSGHILMSGHVVGDYFYTPDIGEDRWEIWSLSDLVPAKKPLAQTQS